MTKRGSEPVWQANPSWLGMIGWYLKFVGLAILAAAFAYGLAHVGVIATAVAVLIGLAAIAAAVGAGHLKRKTTRYMITEHQVIEQFGIINTHSEQARIEQITNVTIDRNILERMLGIGRINIDTANDRADILRWWGVEQPGEVEDLIERLKFDRLDDDGNRRQRRSGPAHAGNDSDDDMESWLRID